MLLFNGRIRVKIGLSGLRRRRREKDWSQGELGRRVGVSTNTILNLEKRRVDPSAALLVALAKELECSTDELLNMQASNGGAV